MLLKDALPEITEELALALRNEGRPDLAEQLTNLDLADRCRCHDSFCASFYTLPKSSWHGKQLDRIIPGGVRGMSCVYTLDGTFAGVELLWRPEVRERLDELLPLVGNDHSEDSPAGGSPPPSA